MNMRNCTIALPELDIECIETMVHLGFFPNRSEALRVIIKQFIDREIEVNEGLKHFKERAKRHMDAIIGVGGIQFNDETMEN